MYTAGGGSTGTDSVFVNNEYVLQNRISYTNSLTELYVNGQALVSRDLDATNMYGNDVLDIGRVDNYFDGNINEILIYDTPLTDVEVTQLNSYLAQRWDLEDVVDSDGDGIVDADDEDTTNMFEVVEDEEFLLTFNITDEDSSTLTITSANIPDWVTVSVNITSYTESGIDKSSADIDIFGTPTQADLGNYDFVSANYSLTSTNITIEYSDSNTTSNFNFGLEAVYVADSPVISMEFATTSIKESVDVSSMLLGTVNITDEDG